MGTDHRNKPLPSGILALRGGRHRGRHAKFCADEGNRIRCNRPWVHQWEKFKVDSVNHGREMSLRGGRSWWHRRCSSQWFLQWYWRLIRWRWRWWHWGWRWHRWHYWRFETRCARWGGAGYEEKYWMYHVRL